MSTKQVIVVRKDLNMRKGKIAAQASHASMAFLTRNLEFDPRSECLGKRGARTLVSDVEIDWLVSSPAKIVVGVESEEALLELIEHATEVGIAVWPIVDNGRTEFGGVPTLTCAAFGPDLSDKLNAVTGHLPLI